MKNFRKIFLTLAASLLSYNVAAADSNGDKVAQENSNPVKPNIVEQDKPQVILFKIHDIKPVLDDKKNVTSCAYTATFYNRTPLNLRQTRVDFAWVDEISKLYPLDAKQGNVSALSSEEGKPTNQEDKNQSSGAIFSGVELPTLNAYKQVSVDGIAQTDKCFAMLDALKFKVSSCSVLGQEKEDTNNKNQKKQENTGPKCASMFVYVNSKNPEYYGQFQKISYEEIQEMEKTAEQKEQEKIDAVNEKINQDFDKATTVMESIK